MSVRRRLPALGARLLRATAGSKACASSTPAARYSALAASAVCRSSMEAVFGRAPSGTAARAWAAGPAALPPLAAGRAFAAAADLPAHVEVAMPALSPTMTQGNIIAWKKKEGDAVAPGDILCEVETDKVRTAGAAGARRAASAASGPRDPPSDKSAQYRPAFCHAQATIEWEAQEEGVIAKILAPDGSKDVPVGTPVCVMVDDAADAAAFKDYAPGGGSAAADAPAAVAAAAAPDHAAAAASGGSFPPHAVVAMPALSPTMTQGNILAWRKKAGDEVAPGDILAEVETDKVRRQRAAVPDGARLRALSSPAPPRLTLLLPPPAGHDRVGGAGRGRGGQDSGA